MGIVFMSLVFVKKLTFRGYFDSHLEAFASLSRIARLFKEFDIE